jgi:RNA polymerase sigma-32 factor
VATTKAQRKLFFYLRSRKQGFRADALDGDTHRNTLSDTEVQTMARELQVKPQEVREMETRLGGGDVLLDPGPSDDGQDAWGPIAYLADAQHEPTAVIESAQRDALATDGVSQALAALDDRARRIVTERWLKVNEDGSGGMTLHDLAAEFGISAERVRQIEVQAMKKMRLTLEAYA